MTIKYKCPICGKQTSLKREFKCAGLVVKDLECGHVSAKKELAATDLSLTSDDGKTPYKYQLEGAEFAVRNGARVLIADEMGLGKTIQALLTAHSDPNEFCPVLVICKAGLKTQWEKEVVRWTGWIFQTIEYEDEFILPGVKGYIVGYDSLAYSEFKNKRGKVVSRGMRDVEAWVAKIGPRTIVLDECQHIKNRESKRTRAVQRISAAAPHLIGLSGTPIMNNAKEYFPILNMLRPDKFRDENGFIARWCESYWNGRTTKVGGISGRKVEDWKNYTSDVIIRRNRKEVLPELPQITRNFRFETLGPAVEEAYKQTFKEFQDYYLYGSNGDSSFRKDGNIIAYLSKMRHLTGIAKINGVIDFATDFMNDTDRKLVVFTHHKDVAKELVQQLNGVREESWGAAVLNLDAPVDPNVVNKFWEASYRLMVASTLAAGEGLNLQCCSDCIMMERQWNPPKEEQAEGRFLRIGQVADAVTATYFTAVGTVDEFFAKIVEQKRAAFKATMDGEVIQWDESSLIKELAEVLAMQGGKPWGI